MNFSIRTKMALFIAGFSIVTVAGLIFINIQTQRSIMQKWLIEKSKSIALYVGEAATDPIYELDTDVLKRRLNNILIQNDTLYVYGFDSEGRILSAETNHKSI